MYDYLSKYIIITKDIDKKIKRHIKRYNLENTICAWYANWEDFCSDWCDECGYNQTFKRKAKKTFWLARMNEFALFFILNQTYYFYC